MDYVSPGFATIITITKREEKQMFVVELRDMKINIHMRTIFS